MTLKKEVMTDENSKVIGNKIIATTIKNRVYPPYQTATVQIDYKNGVNSFAGILDLGIELNLIEKKGSWYSYGDTRLGQGVNNAESALLELKDEIMEKIDKLLETTGYSSYDENVKKAEEIIQQLEEDNESGNVQETKGNRRRKRDE